MSAISAILRSPLFYVPAALATVGAGVFAGIKLFGALGGSKDAVKGADDLKPGPVVEPPVGGPGDPVRGDGFSGAEDLLRGLTELGMTSENATRVVEDARSLDLTSKQVEDFFETQHEDFHNDVNIVVPRFEQLANGAGRSAFQANEATEVWWVNAAPGTYPTPPSAST